MIRWDDSNYLMHYGTKGHSGRYPAGSGENPKTGPRAVKLRTKRDKIHKKLDKLYSKRVLTSVGVAREQKLARKSRQLTAKIKKSEKANEATDMIAKGAKESEMTAHALGYKIKKDQQYGSIYANSTKTLKNGEIGDINIRAHDDKKQYPSSELLKTADKEIIQKLDSWDKQAREKAFKMNSMTVHDKSNLEFDGCNITSDKSGKKIEKTEFWYYNNEDDHMPSVEYNHKKKTWTAYYDG